MPDPSIPPPLRVREADGSPNLIPVYELIISGATLTRQGATGARLLIDSGAGATGAPTGGEYVAYAANADLTAERVLTAGSSVTIRTDASNIYVSAITSGFAPVTRLLTAGSGLTGGGSLEADRTFAVGTNVREKVFAFFAAGTLSTVMRAEETRVYAPFNMEVREVRLAVTTTPVGQAIIVDVGQFPTPTGTLASFYATDSRPTVGVGVAAGSGTGGALTTTTLYSGSYLGIQVAQVGTTSTGMDLTVTVLVRTS